MFRRALLPTILLSVFVIPACDSGPSEADKKAEAAKKAAAAEEAKADAGVNKRRDERLAKEKAAEDRIVERDKLIDELTVLPEEMPKKLDDACTLLVKAQQDFDKKHFDAETVAKLEAAAATRLKMLEQQCISGTTEMAACQIQVLNTLPTGKDFHKDLTMFFVGCAKKFGAGSPPPVPPKPKG
jgi:hypothetical protein